MQLSTLPEDAQLLYNVPEGLKMTTPAERLSQEVELIDIPQDAELLYNTPQSPVDKAAPDTTQPLMQSTQAATLAEEPSLLSGYVQNVQADLSKRADEYSETLKEYNAGRISYPEFILQAFGKAGAGGVLDIAGETITAGLKGVSFLLPDSIEKPVVDTITEGLRFIENTAVGKMGIEALENGADAWNNFKEGHPRAAKNIESVVNIAAIVTPPKVKANTAPENGVSKLRQTADKLDQAAAAKEFGERRAFTLQLTQPRQTLEQRADQARRTEQQGVLRRNVLQYTQREIDVAEEAAKTGVSASRSPQYNVNVLNTAIQKEATSLQNRLTRYQAPIDDYSVISRVDVAVDKLLAERPTIAGDEAAARSLNILAQKAEDLWNASDKTPTALLQVRRDFDSWVKSNKPNVFGDVKVDNISVGAREIRKALNEALSESVPDENIKSSLRRQSLLIEGAENASYKAAEEASNAVGRLWKNVTNIAPFKASTNRLVGAGLGVSVGTAAHTIAPALIPSIGLGLATWALYTGVSNIPLRKSAAALLNATDEALKIAKNPDMVKQLRADRVALIELLKLPVAEQEDEVEADIVIKLPQQ